MSARVEPSKPATKPASKPTRAAAKRARPPAAPTPEPAAPAAPPPPAKVIVRARRSLLSGRRANRRITVEHRSILLWLGEVLGKLARRLLTVAKVLGAVAALAGALWLGRLGVQHVIASSRFALREIRVGPAAHLGRDQIVALSGVAPGDRLLTLDTDEIAARLAHHPWIAAARVRRELPSTLVIEVTERRAAAVATLGVLYLIDENGHAFKQATVEETEGLIVLTGLTREQYAGRRDASESAFREALGLFATYQPAGTGKAARGPAAALRPALSEIHIDPRSGFSLFLYDSGAEIRLGRDDIADKLSRLDQILEALGPGGANAARVIHLDGPAKDRIPIRLADPAADAPVAGASSGAREVKKSTAAPRPVISGKRPVPAPAAAAASAPTGPETD